MNESTLHQVNIKGISFEVYDSDGSNSVQYIEKELNQDDCGLSAHEDLESILDVGAHVGLFSIYAAKKFPRAVITALEPNRESFNHLMLNLEINGISNVFPINKGISANGRFVRIGHDAQNTGGSSYTFGGYDNALDCETTTLAVALQKPNPTDLVKVDIEGMEYEVFLVFDQWEKIKHLSIELHGLSPYPKPMWDLAVKSFREYLNTRPIKGKLWTNDLSKN